MTDWPLHITLADVFAVDREATDIDAKLEKMLSKQQKPTVVARNDTVLGTTPVVLIEKTDELTDLHHQIIDLLESNGAVFNTPEFTRGGFLPHCTIQKSGRVNSGDGITINEITLVDMFPNNDWQRRKVINVYKLGNK